MILPKVRRLVRLVLNVADLQRSRAFYVDALGFEPVAQPRSEASVLRLGEQEIVLAQAAPGAGAYPSPRAANDPWFQHFAIAVADMETAYAHLRPHVSEPISRDGPQRLPPSTGSVTAYKFRDPDGHPLELSFAPQSAWAEAARAGGPLFLGVDHTALAVTDLAASLAFYTGLGLTPGPRLLNHGAEQDRLDGLDGVELDIAVLFTPDPGPHLELLHYRIPGPAPASSTKQRVAPGDVAATETLFSACEGSQPTVIVDPDGHRLEILAETT